MLTSLSSPTSNKCHKNTQAPKFVMLKIIYLEEWDSASSRTIATEFRLNLH
jgi:hypothetical protein